MSKSKEKIVHLGSKSPRRRIQKNHQNLLSYTVSNVGQIDQRNLNYSNILGQSQIPNQHFQGVNKHQISMNRSSYYSNNQPNKLPIKKSPIPRQKSKNSVEKVIVYRKMSPNTRLIKNQQPMMIKNVQLPIKKIDNDLVRKNQILEQRVMQLHQQKQNCMMKLHQQNNRLSADNNLLKEKIDHINQIANDRQTQIENLKKEFSRNNVNSDSHVKIKSYGSLRNDIYIQNSEGQQNETSFLKQSQTLIKSQVQKLSDREINKLNSPLKNHSQYKFKKLYQDSIMKIEKLELKNEEVVKKLKNCQDKKNNSQKLIDDMNEKNLQNLNILQKQNQKLRTEIENKNLQMLDMKNKTKRLTQQNQSLKQGLDQVRKTILQDSAMIEQNNDTIVKNYQIQIIQLNKQIKCVQSQKQNLNHQFKENIQKLNNKNELLMQQIEKEKKQKSEIEEIMKNYEIQNKNLTNKVNLLQKNVKDMQKMNQQKNTQTQQNKIVQECLKSKEILKILMKLNSKTNQK